MQRLIIFSLLLIAAFTPLILATQQIGHTAPPPEVVSLLHLRDCKLPCWAGIVLQRTTLDEAKQHLLALYSEFDPQIIREFDTWFVLQLHDANANSLAKFQVFSEYQLVSRITLTLHQAQPQQLMEIVQVYDLPTCAIAEGISTVTSYKVIFDRADQGAQLVVFKNLQLTALLTLNIETPHYPCRESYPAWRGFTYR